MQGMTLQTGGCRNCGAAADAAILDIRKIEDYCEDGPTGHCGVRRPDRGATQQYMHTSLRLSVGFPEGD